MINSIYQEAGMRFRGIPKLLAKYILDPEVRVRVKVRHIVNESGQYAKYLSWRLQKKYNVIVGANTVIGRNLSLRHYLSVVIGDGVRIGDNCQIYQCVTLGQKNGLYPSVGNNVCIYPGAKVIGDIRIGDNVVIGANAVVTKDVPSNAVVAGVPARILYYRDDVGF